MARVVSAAVLVAVFTVSPMGLVAIVRIIIIVVHGVIVCAVPILLFLGLQKQREMTVSKVADLRRRELHLLLGIADIEGTHLVAPAIWCAAVNQKTPPSSGGASVAPFPSMST